MVLGKKLAFKRNLITENIVLFDAAWETPTVNNPVGDEEDVKEQLACKIFEEEYRKNIAQYLGQDMILPKRETICGNDVMLLEG